MVSNIARWGIPDRDVDLHMVVSTPSVAQLDQEMLNLWEEGKPVPKTLWASLDQALASAREAYDYVLIDCPPGLSLFSSTALIASDYFVAPVIPEPLSLQGVELVQQRARELKAKRKARVEYVGAILNIVKHYRKTHQRVAQMLYGELADQYRPFEYWLPDNERLRLLGEFDPDLGGKWATGVKRKFSTLSEKYSVPYPLANPAAGPLSRKDSEGPEYKLLERIDHVVEELIGRCN